MAPAPAPAGVRAGGSPLLLIYIHEWTARGIALHAGAQWAHTLFGITILLVVLARLLVRSRSRLPPPEPGVPRWQAFGAKGMPLALYVLRLATPLLGIANRMWNRGARASPGFRFHTRLTRNAGSRMCSKRSTQRPKTC